MKSNKASQTVKVLWELWKQTGHDEGDTSTGACTDPCTSPTLDVDPVTHSEGHATVVADPADPPLGSIALLAPVQAELPQVKIDISFNCAGVAS